MKGTGNKTALALDGARVALAGFGLSRIRCAGDLLGLRKEQNQVIGQYAFPEVWSA